MERTQEYALSAAEQQELMDEMEDDAEDRQLDGMEDQAQTTQDYQDAYGAPVPDEKQNAHSFLHKAAFDEFDTTKTTYLTENELGRPLFSVRFMADILDVSKHYIDPLIDELKDAGLDKSKDNIIANYFFHKIKNVTDSGMSNKGFSMNLNVTQKRDSSRRRFKPDFNSGKGGEGQ